MINLSVLEEQMKEAFPVIYVARHGDTAWTVSGQHTGLTDLPLSLRGEINASRLGDRLKGLKFAKVFTSPLQRASRTCELAGFGGVAQIDPDLVEWNYGEYEGRRSTEILAERRIGNCSATDAREKSLLCKSVTELIELSSVFDRFWAMSCCSPVDVSFAS